MTTVHEEASTPMGYELIVGTTLDGWIGDPRGNLPFRQSADLKNFKRLTTDNVIIMGRKTLYSIGALLPHRLNVIITNQPLLVDAWLEGKDTDGKTEDRKNNAPQPLIVSSFEELNRRLPALMKDGQKAFIIGGDSIYKQSLSELNITSIRRTLIHTTIPDASVEKGWARFDMPDGYISITERGIHRADEKNQHPYSFEDYVPKAALTTA